jgi:NADPH2:quinone reductase
MMIDRGGPVPVTKLADVAEPARSAGQVLVEVHASSVNRADLAVLSGDQPPTGESRDVAVPGLDASGVVIEADQGSAVRRGERVMVITRGALAERIVVDDRLPIRLPDSWSFEEGAGAVLVLLTAHNALRTAARLRPDDTVFVNGANSGAGQMAIQVAKALEAGTVIAGVRTRRGDALLEALGAETIINTEHEGFGDRLRNLTGDRGADVIIDHVGGPHLHDLIRAAAVNARIICVGRLGGATGSIDLDALAFKRLELIGVTFRTRTQDELAALVEAARGELTEAMSTGHLKPHIDQVIAWNDVHDAYEAITANSHLGKVVLKVRR